jgi:hypothetical protein
MSTELGATERAILAALAVERNPGMAVSDRVFGLYIDDLTERVQATLSYASRQDVESRAVALDRRQVVKIIPDPSEDDPRNFRVRLAPTTDAERAEFDELSKNAEAALRRGKDNARMEAQRAADLLQEQDNAARSAKLDETVRRAVAGEVVPPDDPAG